jgi:predicted O-linked N-acetylglucosamine transferase (SPINDLY family)
MAVFTVAQALAQAQEKRQAGDIPGAEQICRYVLSQLPQNDAALKTLAEMVFLQGRIKEAIALMRQAVAINPRFASYHNNLGLALAADQQLDAASEEFKLALSINPDTAEIHTNLGNIHLAQRRPDLAIPLYRRALTLKPDHVMSINNLAAALIQEGYLDEAMEVAQRGIELQPESDHINRIVGRLFRESGRLDEAIAWFEKRLAVDPASNSAGDLLFTQLFHPAYDRKRLHEEASKWNQTCAHPLRHLIRPHENERSPDRRLRIGYYSCDLGDHPLGRFILPLLANHDHGRFEIFCYCDFARGDRVSERIRGSVDVWRDTGDYSDQQVADLIRADRVDVLVDLSMQTNGNRMLMLARKPSPVQVTYLAYCGTTGADAIDYRLTDRYLDPPDLGDRYSSEKLVRLPNCFWCYAPPPDTPTVVPPPLQANGFVTFGCLNDFAKVTPDALRTWCAILRAIPASRLLLHAKEGSHRQRVLDVLKSEGVEPQQLSFVGFLPIERYFAAYNQIDIALDSFPYAGGTTTCDALWMGIPVVTLAGQTGVARGGLSILSNLNLNGFVATTTDQYIDLATSLARDLPRVSELRASLRPRMQASPLMNAPQFARDVESIYRQIWRTWCSAGANMPIAAFP